MKKTVSIFISFFLCIILLTGCGGDQVVTHDNLKYFALHNTKVELNMNQQEVIRIDDLAADDAHATKNVDTQWFQKINNVQFANVTFNRVSYAFRSNAIAQISYWSESVDVKADEQAVITYLNSIYGDGNTAGSITKWHVKLTTGETFDIKEQIINRAVWITIERQS